MDPVTSKVAMNQSFQELVQGNAAGVRLKKKQDQKEEDGAFRRKLKAWRRKLAPKLKPKKTPEERAVNREQLQKYVLVSNFMYFFPLRFGTIVIGFVDMVGSGAICALYIFMAVGMLDGTLVDTFEEIGYHIAACKKNPTLLESYNSDRLETAYLVLSMQRYVMITFVILIATVFGVSCLISLFMHEGTKTNERLSIRAWIYLTFLRVPLIVPTGLALLLSCHPIANAFGREVSKLQDEFMRLTSKMYVFEEAQVRLLRNQLLANGAGLLAYGLANVYFLLVVAAFYINMDDIIYKKMTRLTKKPYPNPFLAEGYTPAVAIAAMPAQNNTGQGNSGTGNDIIGTEGAADETRSVKGEVNEAFENEEDNGNQHQSGVKTKGDFMEEARGKAALEKDYSNADGSFSAGDTLSVLNLDAEAATKSGESSFKKDVGSEQDVDGGLAAFTYKPTTIIHSIYTEERFLDPDGGGRMKIYLPVGGGGGDGKEREGGIRLRRNRQNNKKVGFFAEDFVTAGGGQPVSAAATDLDLDAGGDGDGIPRDDRTRRDAFGGEGDGHGDGDGGARNNGGGVLHRRPRGSAINNDAENERDLIERPTSSGSSFDRI